MAYTRYWIEDKPPEMRHGLGISNWTYISSGGGAAGNVSEDVISIRTDIPSSYSETDKAKLEIVLHNGGNKYTNQFLPNDFIVVFYKNARNIVTSGGIGGGLITRTETFSGFRGLISDVKSSYATCTIEAGCEGIGLISLPLYDFAFRGDEELISRLDWILDSALANRLAVWDMTGGLRRHLPIFTYDNNKPADEMISFEVNAQGLDWMVQPDNLSAIAADLAEHPDGFEPGTYFNEEDTAEITDNPANRYPLITDTGVDADVPPAIMVIYDSNYIRSSPMNITEHCVYPADNNSIVGYCNVITVMTDSVTVPNSPAYTLAHPKQGDIEATVSESDPRIIAAYGHIKSPTYYDPLLGTKKNCELKAIQLLKTYRQYIDRHMNPKIVGRVPLVSQLVKFVIPDVTTSKQANISVTGKVLRKRTTYDANGLFTDLEAQRTDANGNVPIPILDNKRFSMMFEYDNPYANNPNNPNWIDYTGLESFVVFADPNEPNVGYVFAVYQEDGKIQYRQLTDNEIAYLRGDANGLLRLLQAGFSAFMSKNPNDVTLIFTGFPP